MITKEQYLKHSKNDLSQKEMLEIINKGLSNGEHLLYIMK